jgi:hypothetical protein
VQVGQLGKFFLREAVLESELTPVNPNVTLASAVGT